MRNKLKIEVTSVNESAQIPKVCLLLFSVVISVVVLSKKPEINTQQQSDSLLSYRFLSLQTVTCTIPRLFASSDSVNFFKSFKIVQFKTSFINFTSCGPHGRQRAIKGSKLIFEAVLDCFSRGFCWFELKNETLKFVIHN